MQVAQPTGTDRDMVARRAAQRQRNIIPPRLVLGQRVETLNRRIANLETIDPGVFTGNTLASFMALPGLVGFWPMSSVQRSTGNVYDLSGQGRTLTYTGNPTFAFYNGLIPYISLDGTGDYLTRADETDLDITGAEAIYTSGAAGLTMGCWAWFDVATGTQGIIGKNGDTGAGTGGYLQYLNGGNLTFLVSGTGSDASLVSAGAPATGQWYFICSRFTLATEIAIFINNAKTSSTTSIPASVFNNATPFQIGAFNSANAMSGRASLCFLCANALGDDLTSSLYEQSRVLFSI